MRIASCAYRPLLVRLSDKSTKMVLSCIFSADVQSGTETLRTLDPAEIWRTLEG